MHNQVKASIHSNATEFDEIKILSVSSASAPKQQQNQAEDEMLHNELSTNYFDDEYNIHLENINPVIHDATTYIAGYVERALRWKNKLPVYCRNKQIKFV